MTLHREGRQTLIITLIFLGILNGVIWRFNGSSISFYLILSVSLIFYLIILQFFRQPSRKIIDTKSSQILAPADGKIVVIEDTYESEYFEGERLLISIFMSPFNVHSNHHPVSGTVKYSKYHPGKYLVAWHPKSSTENERHTIVYSTGSTEILVRQIAGALARRIVNYMKVGEHVEKGGEMGFIKFGSRVDVFLPVGTNYTVSIGQTVRAKLDVIAELNTP